MKKNIFIPILISCLASSYLMGAKIPIPMSVGSLSIENAGTKTAIDAYKDGVGIYVLEKLGNEPLNNNEMNTLVFKYGELAKSLDIEIKEYVLTNGTVAEKELATTVGKFESLVPKDGTGCSDNNIQTINDKFLDGICVGTNVPNGSICDDANAFTIDDKWNNGVCTGVVGVATIKEALKWTDAPINAKTYDTVGGSFFYIGNNVWSNNTSINSATQAYVSAVETLQNISNSNLNLKVFSLSVGNSNIVKPVLNTNGFYEYVSVNKYSSIKDLMLSSYGFTLNFNVNTTQALLFDNSTIMKSSIGNYVPPTITEMFNSWHRTADSEFYQNKATTSNIEAKDWSLITSNGQQSFSNATNTSATIAVISNVYYSTYNMSITVGSTAVDNDEIGVVGSFYKNGSTWEYLMASVRRDSGMFYIRKYTNAGVTTLYTQAYSTGNWPGYKTKFKVTKTESTLKFEATAVNSSSYTYNYTFDLNANPNHKNATGFGFVEQSQQNTFYVDYVFTPTSVSSAGSNNEAYSIDGTYGKYVNGWTYSDVALAKLKDNYLPGSILTNSITGSSYLLQYNNGVTYKVDKISN